MLPRTMQRHDESATSWRDSTWRTRDHHTKPDSEAMVAAESGPHCGCRERLSLLTELLNERIGFFALCLKLGGGPRTARTLDEGLQLANRLLLLRWLHDGVRAAEVERNFGMAFA